MFWDSGPSEILRGLNISNIFVLHLWRSWAEDPDLKKIQAFMELQAIAETMNGISVASFPALNS